MIDAAQRFRLIESTFREIVRRPSSERRTLLDSMCGDDTDLRDEVWRLMELDEQAASRLGETRLADDALQRALKVWSDEAPRPDRIGAYEIEDTIGAGGMGVVYRAMQAKPHRPVALKVLRPGLLDEKALRRFALEAEVLGRLQHPGIAHVYDAGTWNDGAGLRPFFAMELIDGQPLTTYAREQGADRRRRLEIFVKLCEAVHHAHQNGVIHRDLKPGNILVTADGQPKVLDFGIAQTAVPGGQFATAHTAAGQLMGTLPYMSPEQVEGDRRWVDATTDVYSLGVVLYELLTGALPFEVAELSVLDAARTIADEKPRPPGEVDRSLRGDLETIILKAIRRDRDHRYQSALDLAADVRRFLEGRPIEARPASAMYQFRLFARRNRVLVGAAIVVLLVLIAGVVGTSISTVRAVNARSAAESNATRAESELAKAEQVTSFLRQLLAGSSPWIAAGRDTELLRKILDDAAAKIDPLLADQPEAEVLIRDTIGESYRLIGDYDEAESHLQRAYDLATAHLDPDDPAFLETQRNLAWLRIDQGRPDESHALFKDNVRRHRRLVGQLHPDTIADVLGMLQVHIYRYENDEIIASTDRLLAPAREALGFDDHQVQMLAVRRAQAHNNLGNHDEAADLYLELLDQRRRQFGDQHPYTMDAVRGLAWTYRRMGRLEEAQPLYEEYLAHCMEVFGETHQQTANAKNSLALLFKNQGRYDEAERLYREVLEFNRAELGASHEDTLTTMINLAVVYNDTGQYDKAEQLLRERLAIRREQYGPTAAQTLMAQINLAVQQSKAGNVDEGLAIFAETISTARGAEEIDPGNLGRFLMFQGKWLIEAGHLGEAEAVLLESWDLMMGIYAPDHPRCRSTAQLLVSLYDRWDKVDEAAEWRAKAEDIGAVMPDTASAKRKP